MAQAGEKSGTDSRRIDVLGPVARIKTQHGANHNSDQVADWPGVPAGRNKNAAEDRKKHLPKFSIAKGLRLEIGCGNAPRSAPAVASKATFRNVYPIENPPKITNATAKATDAKTATFQPAMCLMRGKS